MTRIKSMCPTCGEVEMNSDQVELVRDTDGRVEYHYSCPKCKSYIAKRADDRITKLLISAGVKWRKVEKVAYPEKIDLPDAPPLTIDDLIELHFEMEERL